MPIEKQRWKLPSTEHGNALTIRSSKAEEHLKQSLDLLYHVLKSIPHTPATELKSQIDDFLVRFK